MSIRFNRFALAAAALGIAIAGSAIAPSSAEASPRHGGHGGGWGHHGGGWGHGGWGHGRPHWGHRPYGIVRIGYGGYGPRCRLVERENRWGDVVVRRVCFGAGWR
jgi:hypothetical protein